MNWEETTDEIRILAGQISNQPEVIISVVRGGLIPARLLAKYLGVRDMYALTIKKHGEQRVVSSEIKDDLLNKRVLLVEDALETGSSMIAARDYLVTLGAVVETAALYMQPNPKIVPDYYLSEIASIPVFPWD